MKIKVDEKQFDIWFRYNTFGKQVHTTAHLKDIEANTELTGWAICSTEDQFNRKVGRKLALKRLFEYYYPGLDNAQFRTNIWSALKNRGMRLN